MGSLWYAIEKLQKITIIYYNLLDIIVVGVQDVWKNGACRPGVTIASSIASGSVERLITS